MLKISFVVFCMLCFPLFGAVTYRSLVNAYLSGHESRNADLQTLSAGSFPGVCLSLNDNDPTRTDTAISEQPVTAGGRKLFATTLVLDPAPKENSPLPVVDAAKRRKGLGGFICSNRFQHFLDIRSPGEQRRSPLECYGDEPYPMNWKGNHFITKLPSVEVNESYDTSPSITYTRRFQSGDLINVSNGVMGQLEFENIYRYRATSFRVGIPGAAHAGTTIKQKFYLRELLPESEKERYLLAFVTDDFYHCAMSQNVPDSRVASQFMCLFRLQK